MNVKIIAADFDGTLCKNNWPEIGAPNEGVIKYLKEQKQQGVKVVLWTCRCGDLLKNAINWCKEHGLEFDAVNDNVQEAIDCFGGDSRKIYADEYIDDRMNTMFKFTP